jgi:hypothetical protein
VERAVGVQNVRRVAAAIKIKHNGHVVATMVVEPAKKLVMR